MNQPDPTLLAISVRATCGVLPMMRDRIRRWLARCGISPAVSVDIVLAADEALANSIEHAYCRAAEPGLLDFVIELDPDTVWFSVVDYGQWKRSVPCPDNARGRGLPTIRAVARQVELIPSSRGTVLTARFQRYA